VDEPRYSLYSVRKNVRFVGRGLQFLVLLNRLQFPLFGHLSLVRELVEERVTEVLPALQTFFLEPLPSGHVQESIGQFVAARRLAGRPIVVSRWDSDD
jgi:hypothetical protein